jgi:hypothetical protein
VLTGILKSKTNWGRAQTTQYNGKFYFQVDVMSEKEYETSPCQMQFLSSLISIGMGLLPQSSDVSSK